MILHDLRYAARNLSRSAGFSVTAVLTFGLGIGAVTALFTVVDQTLLRPLPVPGGERLVYLQESNRGQEANSNPQRLRDWQSASSLAAVAGFYGEAAVLTGLGTPERLQAVRTFGPFLETIGIEPALGRGPTAEECSQGKQVAVLTYKFWSNRLQADPQVLGRVLNVGNKPYTVLGVLPQALDFPDSADLLAPAPLDYQHSPRVAGFIEVIGRLKPDLTIGAAQSELDTIAIRLAAQHPATDAGRRVRLLPLIEKTGEDARSPLLILFGAVLTTLLAGVVNIAGLMLTRGWERRREASIRLALGSGRMRLIRLFLSEAVLLAAAGCLLGLWVASFGIDLLKIILPGDVPRLAAAQLDGRVAGFAVLLSAACALLAGLLPAWKIAAESAPLGLQGSRTTNDTTRAWFVPPQVALSVALLVLTGLLTQSLLALRRTPLGFSTEHVLTFRINLPWETPSAEIQRISQAVLDRLAGTPGVRSAGVIDRLPLGGGSQTGPVVLRGRALTPDLSVQEAGWRTASPSAFGALGVPVLRGRLAESGNKTEVVVNQAFARRYFGAEDPVGHQIARAPQNGKSPSWKRITGVTGDVRRSAQEAAAIPEVYTAWGAEYWPLMSFAVRTAGDPATFAASVRTLVQGIDDNQVVEEIQPMDQHVAATQRTPRLLTSLVGGFSLAALMLAALGLYGLLAGEITRRTREFGIRLALGAEPRELIQNAIGRGLRLAAIGAVFGLVLSRALIQLVESRLFGVRGTDLSIYVLAPLVLFVVAALACWLPARRIRRVDPASALRHD